MRILLLAMLLFLCSIANATNYYVSPTGSDANPGTLAQPFKTISKLNAVMQAGDTAFFRGGTYRSTQGNGAGTHYSINNLTGNAISPIVLMAFPGELPIFNLDNIIPTNSNPFAMVTSNCSYVKLKGFVVKNLRQVADGSGVSRGFMFQNSDNCTIELFDIFNIGGTGFTLDHSDNNLILNCDSHNNGDGASPDSWNFGDGFTCTGGDPSSGNTFRGCRTWMNGDDGWDFFAWSGTKVTIQNCWSFWNSIKPWGPNNTQPTESQMTAPDTSLFMGTSASQLSYQVSQSSGEGFKLGGFNVGGPGPAGMPTTLKKYLDHCLSFQNQGTGYSENMQAQYSHQMSLLNCIAFNNGNDGFGFGVGRSVGIAHIFKNNWSFNNNRIEAGADWVYDGLPDNVSNNYWASVYQGVNYGNLKGTITLNNADFVGLSSAGATSARQADGSLPVLNYLKLVSSSDLIDKGVNVSLPFNGLAPDLGAFEYSSTTSANVAPTANAGVDKTITLPTNSVVLAGTGTDTDGTITGYLWTKISGPTTGTVTGPNLASTTATGLVQGVYKFELKVTDNGGLTDTDTMQVTVNPPANVAPTANAGVDQTITLPTNITNLAGSGTDPDGTITSYRWTKVSGPTVGVITSVTSAITTVTALVQGSYQFELQVTDNSGGTDTDTMTVTVNAQINQSPNANAGVDQNITLPVNTVSTNGSGTDPDGTIASYQWVKISGPASGTIVNATSATTNITGLTQGVYQFQLTVTDNSGATGTDIMQVTVNAATNQAPTANAGIDQNITLPVNTVSTNGSGTDPDGTIASYQWVKISGPASGTIVNATSATTNITGLTQGVYQFQLTVTDNSGATGTDIMQVTVNVPVNLAPTANAGTDQAITLPTNYTTLNGSGADPDGTITAYRWRKISGPANFTITNTNAAATTVTGMMLGVYQFELRVTDNNGAYGRDTVQVTVNPTANVAPTANAGPDQNITLPINGVSLNGIGTDPDGNIASYEWIKISGPVNGTITNTTSAATTVTGLVQGLYLFELAVTDNNGATDTDTLQVTVNAAVNLAPTAVAGLNQSITLPTNSTSLNGSGTDPDGTIATYEWSQVSGPSTATITNANTATPSITGLVQGIYLFQLTVTDNSGATATDIMQISVNAAPPPSNQSPTANAGPDQIITLPTNFVSLNGIGTDPDGTVTSYRWRKISGPTSFNIGSTTSASTTATALVLGVYKFELRVTDNNGATGWDTMQVTVNPAANLLPTANAGLDKTITLPANSTTLNGSGTDPDGTITAYLWRKVSGPTNGSITNTTAATTALTGLVQGIYKFELKVTDNSGATDLDTMQVTVNPAPNQLPTADAGSNQTITLPTNSTTLVGTGTDPDGTITAYAWVKISGPTGGIVTNGSSATTTVTALIQGVYQFQLTVMDNSGATATDIMQVNVNPAPNQGPTANAGLDKQITLPINSVSLTGSGIDPDGTITTYLWRKISGPTSGTITNPAAATTTVTGLVQGVYKFELKVTDNSGATDVDTMQVTVNPSPNVAPTANAGLDQNITLPTNTASLTGSGIDPDGNITTYLWRKISGPISGTITNPAAATTTVTGLVQGVYKFELKVTDNSGATDVDTMQVTVNAAVINQLPTANAGLDQNITLPTNTVSLSGSGTDPDGIITAYLWRKISGPTNGSIVNTTAASTSVSGLVQGVYKFELKVTDNSGATDVDTMQVTVNAALNQPPTANAGFDLTITLPINMVSLNGSGTDPDGTITAYLWRKISGPANGTISNTISATSSATGLVQGVYKFELKVTDNSGATDVDTMQVTVNAAVNQPPTANAGLDQNITLPTSSTSLNGSGTDPDGTITAYLWRKISGPANGTISNTISATSSATGLVQGVYKFELKVTDNSGATDVDTMQVTVNVASNLPPTANAGLDQNITLPTSSTSLNGSGTDPDGTIAAYLWRQIAGPINGTIATTAAATTTVTGLVQGVYKFELKVTDNSGATDVDTMQVTVNAVPPPPTNQPPVANAGSDTSIYLPDDALVLAGTGADSDGTIVSYSWSIVSGAAHLLTNSNAATANLSSLQQGIYEFELTVTDNDGATAKDTIKITVGAGRLRPADIDDVTILGNPVSGTLLNVNINSYYLNRQVIVSLYDVKGEKLFQKEVMITQHIQLEKIDISRFQKGNYFLKVNFAPKSAIVKKVLRM